MRLVVTGGGTGGHVFPALEVALTARDRGHDVAYLGSNRGIEGRQCERVRLDFAGFPSEPLYRLASPRGMRSAVRMMRAASMAAKELRARRAEVVFSSGGYASAPVVQAARKLGLPYVLHEQNSVPGRTNRLLSRDARAVCTVFETAESWFPGAVVRRTGMPVRREFRGAGQARFPTEHSLQGIEPIVLVVGGSQGSAALNDIALATAVRMSSTKVHWLHLTGPSHFESTRVSLERLAVDDLYEMKAYLDADEMAAAVFSASVVVCRAGAGTLAELAAMRRPSVLVPYPKAFGDHQTANAREFQAIGGADLLPQPLLSAATLEARIQSWLHDEGRSAQAAEALAQWDRPAAVDEILSLLGVAERAVLA